jgi:NhaP-type Na+/H+ or K+/H+ antiporter
MTIGVSIEQNSVPAMLLVFGCSVCLFTPISLLIKSKLLLSDTLVATLIGIVFGPVAINLFNPFEVSPENSEWIQVMILASGVVLAIQIVAATLTLPPDFWRTQWKSILVLYIPVTAYTWAVSTLMVWGCCGVSFLTALMVGAMITPTDPVLCNSILKGRFAELHVSTPVREILSGESAGNDGIALPLFLLPVYLLRYYEPDTALSYVATRATEGNSTYPYVPPDAHSVIYSSPGEAVLAWFLEVILYEVCLGALFGMVLGYGFRRLLLFSQRKNWIDHESMLSFSIGLALLVIGVCDVLNIAGFIAAFFAGLFFAWEENLEGVHDIQEAHIQEVIDILVCFAFFIFFGTTIPWSQFNTPELPIWRLFILSVLYMVFHRLPAVMLMYRWLPGLRNHKEAWFVGYFGPTAVGGLWYCSYSRLVLPNGDPRIIPIIWWIVCTSILLHGLSVPFTHLTILTISRSRDPTYRGPRAPEGFVLRTNSIADSLSGATFRDAQGRRLAVSAPIVDAATRDLIRQELNNQDAFGPALTDEMSQISYHQPAGIKSILANSNAADYATTAYYEDEEFDAAAARAKLAESEYGLDVPRGDTGQTRMSVVPRVSFGVSRTMTGASHSGQLSVAAATPSPASTPSVDDCVRVVSGPGQVTFLEPVDAVFSPTPRRSFDV